MSDVISLAKQLIACPSITPEDAGCQEILISRLEKLGFFIELLPSGKVKNFWARRGTTGPVLVFVGHTDVVPTGPLTHWTSPPFQPEIREDFLYGRGAADMKSSLAAMLVACEKFIADHPNHQGSIAWLITSDEEGPSVDGTVKVVELLQMRQEKIDWCLVGEPSSSQQLGDTLKIGRRGSLSAKLIIQGKQGHIAYPHLADNPIHKSLLALNEIANTQWDEGNTHFQPTQLQISDIAAGTGAGNVIPGEIQIDFNLRYSPLLTADELKEKIITVLQKYQLPHTIHWHHSGKPFLSNPDKLAHVCSQAIAAVVGITPQLSTSGGTSDARFMAATGCQIVELGPRNATIHQIDENVAVADVLNLSEIYQKILELLFNVDTTAAQRKIPGS